MTASKRLTTRQVADVLGCSIRHVQHLIQHDRLPAKPNVLPWGAIVYSVKPTDVAAYNCSVQGHGGFPRGAKRRGRRGKLVPERSE